MKSVLSIILIHAVVLGTIPLMQSW